MDNNLLYKSFVSANSILFCQLSGHLLFDNMKLILKYDKDLNNEEDESEEKPEEETLMKEVSTKKY